MLFRSGGQQVIDHLEKELGEAEDNADAAKEVVESVNEGHHPAYFPAGLADDDESALEMASKRSIMYAHPDEGGAPLVYEGVHPAGATTVVGTPYSATSPNPYNTIYGQFVNYPHIRHWAAEDSAAHAYTLSKWRANILKEKIEQAKLQQSLLEQAGELPVQGEDGEEDEEEHEEDAKRGAEAKEVAALKGDLLQVAEQTHDALSAVSSQVQQLRSSLQARPASLAAAAPSSPPALAQARTMALRRVAGKAADARGSEARRGGGGKAGELSGLGKSIQKELGALGKMLG